MFTKRVQGKKVNGEGFAFFRWHCMRYPDLPGCDGCANSRNVCVAYWAGNVR